MQEWEANGRRSGIRQQEGISRDRKLLEKRRQGCLEILRGFGDEPDSALNLVPRIEATGPPLQRMTDRQSNSMHANSEVSSCSVQCGLLLSKCERMQPAILQFQMKTFPMRQRWG